MVHTASGLGRLFQRPMYIVAQERAGQAWGGVRIAAGVAEYEVGDNPGFV